MKSAVEVNQSNLQQLQPQHQYIINRNDATGNTRRLPSDQASGLQYGIGAQNVSRTPQVSIKNTAGESFGSDVHYDEKLDQENVVLDNPLMRIVVKHSGHFIGGKTYDRKELCGTFPKGMDGFHPLDVQTGFPVDHTTTISQESIYLPQYLPSQDYSISTQQLHQQLEQLSYPSNVNQDKRIINSSFPLNDYHFRLVCELCLNPLNTVGFFFFNGANQHICQENILAVQCKGDSVWLKVRERKNHRNFLGSYKLCKSQDRQLPINCHHGDLCMFAHNNVEQLLWTKEKDGEFDISEFICQSRSAISAPMYTIEALLTKYPGEVRFLCGSCYYEQQRLCPQSIANPAQCSVELHDWQVSINI